MMTIPTQHSPQVLSRASATATLKWNPPLWPHSSSLSKHQDRLLVEEGMHIKVAAHYFFLMNEVYTLMLGRFELHVKTQSMIRLVVMLCWLTKFANFSDTIPS